MAENQGGTPAAAGTPEQDLNAQPAAIETPPAGNPPADPKPAETPPAGNPPADPPPAENPPADPKPAEPASTDWAAIREKFSNGDDKLLKRLSRYSSLESALEAMVAAQDKIAKGEHKAPLADDATPEEVAAWREANGIPAEASGYELKLEDGLVIGDNDKPIVDGYLNVAHELNMKPEEVNKTLNWFFNEREKAAQLRIQQDEQVRQSVNAELASPEIWGGEAQLNKNLILGMLDSAPAGVKDTLLNSRAPDGTPLASSIPMLRWMADVARTLNPTATVVPGSGTNAMQTIETELANLTKMMGDKTSEYWKGPMAEKHQARYRDLIDVQQKLQAK